MKVLVNGQLIEYKDQGKGRVLVFLHGWGDQLATFDDIAKHLSQKYRIVRIDFPGFGGSPKPRDDWTVKDYAVLTSAFLKKIGITEIYCVAGHSFGGRVIIKAIAENLMMPSKVLLIGAAGVKPKQQARKFAYKVVAKVGKAVTAVPGLRHVRHGLRKKLYESAGATDYLHAEGMQQIFRNTVNEDLLPLVHFITQPSLLIWGESDTQTPVADAYVMMNVMDNAELVIVENAGHFVHHDNPTLVQQKIDEFLG